MYDGLKSVPLSQLPPEAWRSVSGGDTTKTSALYAAIPAIYRGVNLRAGAISSMPFNLYRIKGKGSDKPITDQPAWESIVKGFRAAMWQEEASLCVYGRSFHSKDANPVGRNITPHWLLPTTMKVEWNQQGITGYERRVPMQNGAYSIIHLDVKDVVYTRLPSLVDEVAAGVAPVAVAMQAAGVLRNLQAFIAHYFERGAIKATLLQVAGNPQKAELDRLEAWWKRFFKGIKSAWETIAVRADVTPVVIGEGIADLHNKELTDSQREEIALALGVPMTMLFANAANYATSQQDTLNFYNNTILPQCALIAETWNAQLFRELGIELWFEPEKLEVYQAAELEKAQNLKALAGEKAILTVNEVREQLGYEPLSEEELNPPPPPMPTDPNNPNPPPNDDTPQEPPTKWVDDLTLWERKAVKRSKDNKTAAVGFVSEFISPEVRAWVTDGLRHATTLDEVRDAFKVSPDDFTSVTRGLADKLTALFDKYRAIVGRAIVEGNPPDITALSGALKAELLVTLEGLLLEAAEQLADENGVPLDPAEIAAAANVWATQYVATTVGKFDSTTRTLIEAVVRKYETTPGMTRAQVEKLLEGALGAKRAEVTAITEITRAASQATRHYQETLKGMGIEMKRVWNTNNDSLTCPICGPLNGKSEDEYEGEPPAHPRCRCFETLRLVA